MKLETHISRATCSQLTMIRFVIDDGLDWLFHFLRQFFPVIFWLGRWSIVFYARILGNKGNIWWQIKFLACSGVDREPLILDSTTDSGLNDTKLVEWRNEKTIEITQSRKVSRQIRYSCSILTSWGWTGGWFSRVIFDLFLLDVDRPDKANVDRSIIL